MTALPSWLPVQ